MASPSEDPPAEVGADESPEERPELSGTDLAGLWDRKRKARRPARSTSGQDADAPDEGRSEGPPI